MSTATFHPISPSSIGEPNAGGVRPVWAETKWPFPIDQWGSGKAYACRAADCGTDVELYVRAKIGFCDCGRGVEDDAELERVSDIDLITSRYRASGPGRPITVGSMNGRSRPFAITGSGRSAGTVLTVAFHDRCDLIVATAVISLDRASESEGVVMQFLNSAVVLRWLETTLGL